MSEAAGRLCNGLARLGFVDEALALTLLDFAKRVLEANKRTNLVGAQSLDELITSHILDSLAPLSRWNLKGRLIDIGSGAGFPAIPIAIVFRSVHVTMLEPRAKRVEFLTEVVDKLELRNCEPRKVMAETAGRSELRETANAVTLRAVAKPTAALELSLPLLKRGGRALLYIGRQAAPTERELAVADRLGGQLVEAKEVEVPYLQGVRHAWWFEKKMPTPNEYPRRAKVPSKQPL